MLNPYPLEENDSLTYGFETIQGIKYKIYFLDYSYLFDEFPQINCPIYSFNIELFGGNPEISTKDDRVGVTIAYILFSFFEQLENVAVYVCDPTDERHHARKRKFDIWFKTYNDGSLVKKDGVANAGGMVLYNSIIFHKDHPEFHDLILAFNSLNSKADEK